MENAFFFFFYCTVHTYSSCRILVQTTGRSVGTAVEYMTKVTYQDSMREQMVAASPSTACLKPPGR